MAIRERMQPNVGLGLGAGLAGTSPEGWVTGQSLVVDGGLTA